MLSLNLTSKTDLVMSKKIVLFNGAPRPDGNTSELVSHFVEGAEEAGHKVTTFIIENMNIHGCKGCFKGGKDPNSPCVQKDDMDKIYPVFEEADVVIFASPMYYWSITSQLKAVVDRLFAIVEKSPTNDFPHKECAMLMAAGGEGESNDKPVVQFFDSLMSRLSWDNRGLIIAGGVLAKGDIDGSSKLNDAKELGKNI